jgi:hypothetical protein
MLDQMLDGNNLKSLAVRLVIRKRHAEGRAFARRPLTGFYWQQISGVRLKRVVNLKMTARRRFCSRRRWALVFLMSRKLSFFVSC